MFANIWGNPLSVCYQRLTLFKRKEKQHKLQSVKSKLPSPKVRGSRDKPAALKISEWLL